VSAAPNCNKDLVSRDVIVTSAGVPKLSQLRELRSLRASPQLLLAELNGPRTLSGFSSFSGLRVAGKTIHRRVARDFRLAIGFPMSIPDHSSSAPDSRLPSSSINLSPSGVEKKRDCENLGRNDLPRRSSWAFISLLSKRAIGRSRESLYLAVITFTSGSKSPDSG